MSESNSVQLDVSENTNTQQTSDSTSDSTSSANTSSEQQVRLVDIDINSENIALNVLIGFLSVAQKRGTFLFDESAKISECIKVFMKPTAPTSN